MMKRKKPPEKQYYCRDCAHAVNRYCKSMATGENIMAECEKKDVHVLLSFPACGEFKAKLGVI